MTKKIVCYTIVYSLEVIYIIYIFSSNITLQEVFSIITFNSSVYKKFLIELINPKLIFLSFSEYIYLTIHYR